LTKDAGGPLSWQRPATAPGFTQGERRHSHRERVSGPGGDDGFVLTSYVEDHRRTEGEP
jgi:hypothetical protein